MKDSIIVTTYQGADLDGYSCAMAYAEFLRAKGMKAEARVWRQPNFEVRWLIEKFHLSKAKGSVENSKHQVVLVDASDPAMLPEALHPDQVIEIIDHRKLNYIDKFVNAKAQIELVGAAATLVAERFQEAGIQPSQESALFLYGGIVSNTQNFKGVTTNRDRQAAKWLAPIAKAPSDLAEQMFWVKSDLSGDKLETALKEDTKVLEIHGKVVGTAQLEIIGVNDLVKARVDEIDSFMKGLVEESGCDYAFVNLKELNTGDSMVYCADKKTKNLLSGLPDVEWDGQLGRTKMFSLRKQITAWIDERLEG